jgi:hypothetical protein
LRTSPERFIEELGGDTDGNNGRGVVGEEDGITVGQAELCHIRPHTSKSVASKRLRDCRCRSSRCYRRPTAFTAATMDTHVFGQWRWSDIGITTRIALSRFLQTGDARSRDSSERASANGSIMPLAQV